MEDLSVKLGHITRQHHATGGGAGVLVLFCQAPQGWQLVLTKRALNLRQHAGEIAFPGGKLEAVDHGSTALAALRETQEELGVQALPCLLGPLAGVQSLRGTPVQPWVGYLPSVPAMTPCATEVAEVIIWPVKQWLNTQPSWHQIQTNLNGPQWYIGPHRVWGLTAFVLWRLRQALLET